MALEVKIMITQRLIGGFIVVVLIVILVISVVGSQCACTEDGYCYCPEHGEDLHNVKEEDLQRLPEPEQSMYRYFLEAWETEYEERNLAWASLYSDFHAESRTSAERRDFHRQLAEVYREFLALFRARHESFRMRLGIPLL